ncbi:hypothetical protein MHBO_003389 [Bonamia ostreae]|uniref:Uncharacterized protein n=1 Tax=Bonamia ostreae TaxID=126728 RepID=A0ABV2AQU3_9EUKA
MEGEQMKNQLLKERVKDLTQEEHAIPSEVSLKNLAEYQEKEIIKLREALSYQVEENDQLIKDNKCLKEIIKNIAKAL